jgi:hypothetical protein
MSGKSAYLLLMVVKGEGLMLQQPALQHANFDATRTQFHPGKLVSTLAIVLS